MMTPLITTHFVVCTPSLATEINVQDSQVNHLPPALIPHHSCDIRHSCFQARDAHRPSPLYHELELGWHYFKSQLIKAPPDSTPIKPRASMIIKTSTPYQRFQSYALPTKASGNPSDPKLRAYTPLLSLIILSRVADGEPRIPFATRQLLATKGQGGGVTSYIKILDPLWDQEGYLELSDTVLVPPTTTRIQGRRIRTGT